MANFQKRTITDQSVQFPFRYERRNTNGTVIDTIDMIPKPGTVNSTGTETNKAYLQPIEDFLATVDLDGIDTKIKAVDARVTASNTSIATTNAILTNATATANTNLTNATNQLNTNLTNATSQLNTTLATKAPLNSPNLVNPTSTANPAQTDNSTRLATTQFVTAKLDALMTAFKG